jgi:hypothetical protein
MKIDYLKFIDSPKFKQEGEYLLLVYKAYKRKLILAKNPRSIENTLIFLQEEYNNLIEIESYSKIIVGGPDKKHLEERGKRLYKEKIQGFLVDCNYNLYLKNKQKCLFNHSNGYCDSASIGCDRGLRYKNKNILNIFLAGVPEPYKYKTELLNSNLVTYERQIYIFLTEEDIADPALFFYKEIEILDCSNLNKLLASIYAAKKLEIEERGERDVLLRREDKKKKDIEFIKKYGFQKDEILI